MKPILLQLGPIKIFTYGFAMASAYLICTYLGVREARLKGFDAEKFTNTCLYILIGILLGGRVLYIITQFSRYLQAPLDIFKVWEGGMVYYGGLLGGLFMAIFYAKKSKQPLLAIFDIIAIYIGLGYAIHRFFGCFLGAGCCFGLPTDMPWGVTYPSHSPASKLFGTGTPVHPTQIYEAIGGLITFIILMTYKHRKRFDGELIILYFWIYSAFRFITEFFRGDSDREYIGPISTSQFIGIIIFIACTSLYFWLGKYRRTIYSPRTQQQKKQRFSPRKNQR